MGVVRYMELCRTIQCPCTPVVSASNSYSRLIIGDGYVLQVLTFCIQPPRSLLTVAVPPRDRLGRIDQIRLVERTGHRWRRETVKSAACTVALPRNPLLDIVVDDGL